MNIEANGQGVVKARLATSRLVPFMLALSAEVA
jgi:hypothetical protein